MAEHKVLNRFLDRLSIAFKASHLKLANELVSSGILPRDVLDKALTLGVDDATKTTSILKCAFDQVQVYPKKYRDFMVLPSLNDSCHRSLHEEITAAYAEAVKRESLKAADVIKREGRVISTRTTHTTTARDDRDGAAYRQLGRASLKRGKNTPEYRTLIKCGPDLSNAVKLDICDLSDDLLSKGLITAANRDSLTNAMINVGHRASELVSMIRTRVELDAMNFHRFIDTLMMRVDDHRDILRILDEGYKSNGGQVDTGIAAALHVASPNQESEQRNGTDTPVMPPPSKTVPAEVPETNTPQPTRPSSAQPTQPSSAQPTRPSSAQPTQPSSKTSKQLCSQNYTRIVIASAAMIVILAVGMMLYPGSSAAQASDTATVKSEVFNWRIFPHMDKKPTMPQLTSLDAPGKQTVRIIERIGSQSSAALGGILLNDEHGVLMKNIHNDERGVTQAVNREMLRQWLQGRGAEVSWKKLVGALDTVGLRTLSDDIVDLLQSLPTQL